ncbi:MAG: hypothetical protein ACRD00_03760, partial [Thermoanaerobaculia bacterium]
MPEAPAARFQKVLFHGKPVGELLFLLAEEKLQPGRFDPKSWRLKDDEIGVLLADASLARQLAAPPPPDVGQAADRVGVIVLGDSLDSADPFWSARVFFSLPEGAASLHLARAVRSVFRILEDRTVSARARRSLA